RLVATWGRVLPHRGFAGPRDDKHCHPYQPWWPSGQMLYETAEKVRPVGQKWGFLACRRERLPFFRLRPRPSGRPKDFFSSLYTPVATWLRRRKLSILWRLQHLGATKWPSGQGSQAPPWVQRRGITAGAGFPLLHSLFSALPAIAE